MDNIFLKEFKETGMTYREFGKKLGVKRGSAFIYVKTPGRISLLKAIEVGAALGISADESKALWISEKQKRYNDKLKKNL